MSGDELHKQSHTPQKTKKKNLKKASQISFIIDKQLKKYASQMQTVMEQYSYQIKRCEINTLLV